MVTPRFSKVVGLRSAPEWVLSGTVSLGRCLDAGHIGCGWRTERLEGRCLSRRTTGLR